MVYICQQRSAIRKGHDPFFEVCEVCWRVTLISKMARQIFSGSFKYVVHIRRIDFQSFVDVPWWPADLKEMHAWGEVTSSGKQIIAQLCDVTKWLEMDLYPRSIDNKILDSVKTILQLSSLFWVTSKLKCYVNGMKSFSNGLTMSTGIISVGLKVAAKYHFIEIHLPAIIPTCVSVMQPRYQ